MCGKDKWHLIAKKQTSISTFENSHAQESGHCQELPVINTHMLLPHSREVRGHPSLQCTAWKKTPLGLLFYTINLNWMRIQRRGCHKQKIIILHLIFLFCTEERKLLYFLSIARCTFSSITLQRIVYHSSEDFTILF